MFPTTPTKNERVHKNKIWVERGTTTTHQLEVTSTTPNKQTPTRQTRLAQLMYDWQNIGTKKERLISMTTNAPQNVEKLKYPVTI